MLALAGGCSTTVDHPSLAPRTIERFSVASPEAPLPPLPAVLPEDASRQDRANALLAQARAADDRFRSVFAEAQGAIAGGSSASPGSETWILAQEALSRAEILREPVLQSLADLDALQISAAEAGIGTESEASLAAALREVVEIDTRQNREIATLRERLPNP